MRIGLMLRSLDEKGGIGVYTRNISEELFRLDRKNEYVLFYRSGRNLGRFSRYENVSERLVRAPNKAFWDQIAIPLACRREKIDVLFHPKFTVPLLAPCKTVMVLHGADWFIPEYARFYPFWDIWYLKLFMPLYCRKARFILSVSQLTTDHFYRLFKLPAGKVRTVYFAPARHFRRITDEEKLRETRSRYRLPERYILTLSKVGGGSRKNIEAIFSAYAYLHGRVPHKLVIAGKDCEKFRDLYGIPADGFGADIVFPGWIDQMELPALYSMADLYLYPSNLEAFPIPITEAMACGTPIVTSNVNGLDEIAGKAAIQVDPTKPEEIAEAAYRVLSDSTLQQELSVLGLERSKRFNWDRCARETLETLERAGGLPRTSSETEKDRDASFSSK